MVKEHRFVFNNTIIIVEEPYKKDKGCVVVGKKLYDEVEILFKSYDKTLIEFFIKLQEYIANLEEQLKNAIVPKFKIKQTVYSMLGFTEIFKGQIDVFDYYTQRYWVFFGDDIGCEWLYENEIFKTRKEAQAKLQELKGEKKCLELKKK